MSDFEIRRLGPADAPDITACFERVYGTSYATPHFYDTPRLAELIASQQLYCVGAVDAATGTLVGHMALTAYPQATSAELGNTVVAPEARGGGVAWKVGAALSAWARELGYTGFVHYPTTDHHIMQRHSVKAGFETGLMLGYIPAATDGKVGGAPNALRQAATIVYEPYRQAAPQAVYAPSRWLPLLRSLAEPTRLPRSWHAANSTATSATSQATTRHYPARDLARLTISASGGDVGQLVGEFVANRASCWQIDLAMDDAYLGLAADAALKAGFLFCGWLPGFARCDILRLQKVAPATTDFSPALVNPTAQRLLAGFKQQDQAAGIE